MCFMRLKMKVWKSSFCILQMILSYRVIYTSPVSPASGQTLLREPTAGDSDLHICKPVKAKLCSKMYNSTVLPNVYGDISSEEANEKVKTILNSFSQNSSVIIAFVCTLYLPPCFHINSDFPRIEGITVGAPPPPCRQLCQLATDEAQRLLVPGGQLWPAKCPTLPTENCFNVVGKLQYLNTLSDVDHVNYLTWVACGT